MKAFRCFLPVLLLLFCTTGFAQKNTRPVPPGIWSYTFLKYDTTNYGCILTVPFLSKEPPGKPGFSPPSPMILDKNGYLAWYMITKDALSSDLNYFPKERLFSYISFFSPKKTVYYLLDTAFNKVDSVSNVNGVIPDAHEFLILSNGHYLIGGELDSIFDLHTNSYNGFYESDSTLARGYVLQEFDREHHLVFQWNSNQYIHPSQGYPGTYSYQKEGFDYCHGNAIAEDTDGNFLISFRYLNSVYKIDRKTGKVLWRLGGKSNSFRFIDDFGFSGQHDIRVLPGGRISLFDNANNAPDPKRSRAVEYELDIQKMTAHKTWEYFYPIRTFSSSLGSYQRCANNAHLINYGFVFRPAPSILLLDSSNRLATKVSFTDSIKSYRSHVYDVARFIHRPEITCRFSEGKITLTAPDGEQEYTWSNGKKEQRITVEENGAYAVWVKQGIGMCGSEPVIIKDILAGCPSPKKKTTGD